MDLALGRVKECPLPNEAVRELKDEIVNLLSSRGLQLRREEEVVSVLSSRGVKLERASGDRDELPIDFRVLDLLLRAAEDPDTQLGAFAQRVKVGPGTRMPRHPRYIVSRGIGGWILRRTRRTGNNRKRNSRDSPGGRTMHRWFVLEDQAGRRQVLQFTAADAQTRFPDLVAASLGAQRKDKPDGTQGLAVNTRTRIRYRGRSPIAADLKRAMKEKAELLRTHRRRERSSRTSSCAPVRLEMSWLSNRQGFDDPYEHGVNIRNYVSFTLLEQDWCSHWQNLTVRGRRLGGDMAHARRR